MGLEYYMVRDKDKTYCRLGKKTTSSGFQLPDDILAHFLIEDYDATFRLINDAGNEFDVIMEDDWTENSGSATFWSS